MAPGTTSDDRQRPLAPSAILRGTPKAPGGGQDRATLVAHARRSIAEGSKSFALASRLFDRATRERVWLLYAWARRCDDLADNQDHGGTLGERLEAKEAEDRLQAIRVLTRRAMDGQPTADPAFDGFGLVADEMGITADMVDDVVAGFALDAQEWRPRTEQDLMRYCYHVAGAVGVMMARVMGAPDEAFVYDRACDLGLAFQLANIARDIEEDAAGGRCYIPEEWLAEADLEPGQHDRPENRAALSVLAARLVERMEAHEQAARLGAARLRFRQRWAVLSAARIYGAIGRKVRERGPLAWNNRTYVGTPEKLVHVLGALGEAIANRPEQPAQWPRFTREELRPPKGW